MKKTVYIETSIVSYLTARGSRDLISAARQQLTQEWWSDCRPDFDLFVSPLVVDEALRGDSEADYSNGLCGAGVCVSRNLYSEELRGGLNG